MPSKIHVSRIFSLLMIVIMLAGMGGAARSLASPTTPSAPTAPMVVRLYVRDLDQLQVVASDLDIWESHPDELYVVALVKPEEYQWLANLGYRMEVDTEKTDKINHPEAVLDPRYAYFDINNPNSLNKYMYDFMVNVNAAYPDLVEMIDIGDAWQGLHMGINRDIWALRITNEDPAYGDIASKPVFYLHGGVHAREVVIPELLMRYISYLTSGYNGTGGYGVDPDATWLVNHQTVYVVITSNPDGHVVNEEDWFNYRRKNMDNDDGCSFSDSWGVDLNRNFSFKWGCCGGSSSDPCSDTYRGPARASEPETIAIQNHVMSVIADQNGNNGDDELPGAAPLDTTGVFLSMHSYSDLTLFPWGATNTLPDPPNLPQLTTLGHRFAYDTGYTTFSIWYDTDGGAVDWAYGKLGIASYTFEVGPSNGTCGDFFPAYECIDGAAGYSRNFWAENRPAFIYAHKIAKTPYMTSYGPDSQELAVLPETVPQGTPVTLTANLLDHRCCGDPLGQIAGAEYFIDAPGDDGTGTAMTPSDGAWNETNEDGTAVVDTSALEPGQHYILVHSRNNAGDWGPFTAVFVNTTPATTPIAGFTFSPEQPHVSETVQFTDTSAAAPTEFFWDFGDGNSSYLENPTHVFSSVDTFTVTHTVTNSLGSDTIALPVQVLPVDVAGVELTLETTATLYSGDTADFSAVISPDNAAPPFNYTINYGDDTESSGTTSDLTLAFSHQYVSGGNFTVTIKVWNNSMPPSEAVTDSVQVTVIQMRKFYLPFVSK